MQPRVLKPRPALIAAFASLSCAALLVIACKNDDGHTEAEPAWMAPMLEAASGGDTTVTDVTPNAFSMIIANMEAERSDPHFAGNSLFNKNWVAAPASAAGRDGLGPLFNARSCSACHFKDGRGKPPLVDGEEPVALLLRLGRAHSGARAEEGVDPVYGGQIQNFALPGISPEGQVRVEFETVQGTYDDGSAYELRRPKYRLEDPAYGPIGPGMRLGPRLAPPVFGLGLLEAVPEADIRSRVDVGDADGDGISGRVNMVLDRKTGKTTLGRFGWKAGQPTIAQQSAAAFNGDMGLTTDLFPDPNHTAGQEACHELPDGGSPEVDSRTFDFIVFYMQTLAPPARRNPTAAKIKQGARLFHEAGCDACHVPELRTGENAEIPELSDQPVRAYTDLLLHDMGLDLADGVMEAGATGVEWRTAPLWGIGLIATVRADGDPNLYLMHDGRARNVAEAILWHGGEAEASQKAFRAMSAADREALIAFVMDL